MKRFNRRRIRDESWNVRDKLMGTYNTLRLKRPDVEQDATVIAQRYVCSMGLPNADKVTLEVWRMFRYVLPEKGDIATANTKDLINAVRRRITEMKSSRKEKNLAEKRLSVEKPLAW